MGGRTGIVRSIKDVFSQFRRYKIGFLGFIIIVVFIFIAVFAPFITQNDPNAMGVADSWAMPIWMKLHPEYKDLPPNLMFDDGWDDWIISGDSIPNVNILQENLTISSAEGKTEGESQSVELIYKFEYMYAPPKRFIIKLPFEVNMHGSKTLQLKLYLVDSEDKRWELYSGSYTNNISYWNPPLVIDSRSYLLNLKLGFGVHENVAKKIMDLKGVYKILLQVKIIDCTSNAKGDLKLTLGRLTFRIPGQVYGLLGTDNFGGDLFSQLIYSSRVSLIVGILAASISISIGTIVGVIAGFKGGLVDQILIYFTDTLIFLPIIPLLIALSVYFGKNLYFMIILIASLSWMGLARQSRAFVMSLRESMFVEAERAIGASEIYIVFKHVIPQLAPLIYVGIIFRVPGAILLEAALSFLGLGDPRIPSWGKMLYNARYAGAFGRLTWWWLIPPGLCITILTLAFIFMGHALDEILNPRLKARR